MKNVAALAAVVAATLIWAVEAQEPITPVQDSLVPVPGSATDAFDAERWAKALRDTDLVARRRAYESVLDEASRVDEVYETVKAWAEGGADVELAWTAQLMLRELEADPFAGLRRARSPLHRSFGFAPRANDDLLEQLDELFDRYRAFDPFDDLKDLHGMQLLPGGTSRSEGLSIEQTLDGVRVELREKNEDGEEQVRTYEAESMEALLDAHPELKDRIGSGGLEFHLGSASPFDRSGGLLDPQGQRDFFGQRSGSPFPGGQLRPIAPRTDVLGVQVLGPEHRTQPVEGVRSDLGLEVVEVLPGSLAALAGVEVGDVIFAINGVEIASPEDVKGVLEKRGENGALRIETRDLEGVYHSREWVPAGKEKRRF